MALLKLPSIEDVQLSAVSQTSVGGSLLTSEEARQWERRAQTLQSRIHIASAVTSAFIRISRYLHSVSVYSLAEIFQSRNTQTDIAPVQHVVLVREF